MLTDLKVMATPTRIERSPIDRRVEAHREVIRRALDDIAVELETSLQNANLKFPVYLIMPNSGTGIITMATSADPPDSEWAQVSAIVCDLVARWLGGINLTMRELQCSIANAKLESVEAELTQ